MDLCQSCEHYMKVVGYGKELKECRRFDAPITFPVQKCSAFQPKGTLALYEMKEMATYIEKKKDAPGFVFTKRKPNDYIDHDF